MKGEWETGRQKPKTPLSHPFQLFQSLFLAVFIPSFMIVTAVFFQQLSNCVVVLILIQPVNRSDYKIYNPGMLIRPPLCVF